MLRYLRCLSRLGRGSYSPVLSTGAICWYVMPPELQLAGLRRPGSSTSSDMSSVKGAKVKPKVKPIVHGSDRMPSLSDGRSRGVISTNNCSGTLFSICAVNKEAANKVRALHMDKDKLISLAKRPGSHKVTSDMLVDFKSKLRTVASEIPKPTFGEIRKRALSDRCAGSDAAKIKERGNVVESALKPSSAEKTDERTVRSFTRGNVVKSIPVPSSAMKIDKRSDTLSSMSSLTIPTGSISQGSSLSGYETPKKQQKPYLDLVQMVERAKIVKPASMRSSAVKYVKKSVRSDTLSSMSSLSIPTMSLSRGSSLSGHGTPQTENPHLVLVEIVERAKVLKSASKRSSAIKYDKKIARSDTLSSMSSLSIPTQSLSQSSSLSGLETPQSERPYLDLVQIVERAKVLKSASVRSSAVKMDKRTIRSDTLSSMSSLSLSIPTVSLSQSSSLSGFETPQTEKPLDLVQIVERAKVLKSASKRSSAAKTDKKSVRSDTLSSMSSLSIPTGSISRGSSLSGYETPQKQMPYLDLVEIVERAKVLKFASMPSSAMKTDKRTTVKSDTLSSMSSLSIPTGSPSRSSSLSGHGTPQTEKPYLDLVQIVERAKIVKPASMRSSAVKTGTLSSMSSLSIPTQSLSRSSSFSGFETPQKQMPYLWAMSICQKKVPGLSDALNPTSLLTSFPMLLRYKSECRVDYVPKTRRSEVKVSHCINNIYRVPTVVEKHGQNLVMESHRK